MSFEHGMNAQDLEISGFQVVVERPPPFFHEGNRELIAPRAPQLKEFNDHDRTFQVM